MNKRVAVLTNFFGYDEQYSLIRVAKDQIKMLLDNGYDPIFIASESFQPADVFADPRVSLRKIPNVPCHNEVKKDPTFDEDVASIEVALREHLKDVDVVITHDIVYKPSELKYNFVIRKLAQEFTHIKWLHWIHSATPPITLMMLMNVFTDEYLNLVKQPFPNSKYVYFNDLSKRVIAKNFSVGIDDVRTVHHPSDLNDIYGVKSAQLQRFIHDKEIYQADAICVYPARLDRGKQVHYAIKTMAMVKRLGLDVRMIVVDFHSTGGDKVAYRDEMKNMGYDAKLDPQELSFTSEFCPEWSCGIPHEDVLALFRMMNVFIMPSVSESYSLITQEAGLTKSVVVLNQDFPPFRDIFGNNAIYRKYSSNWDVMAPEDEAYGQGTKTLTEYGPGNVSHDERVKFEEMYHKDTAGMIIDRLRHDPAMSLQIHLRKNRNMETVFKKELEPLFHA